MSRRRVLTLVASSVFVGSAALVPVRAGFTAAFDPLLDAAAAACGPVAKLPSSPTLAAVLLAQFPAKSKFKPFRAQPVLRSLQRLERAGQGRD